MNQKGIIRLVAQVNVNREEMLAIDSPTSIDIVKQSLSKVLVKELFKWIPDALQQKEGFDGSLTYRVEFLLIPSDGKDIFRYIPQLDTPLKSCSIIVMEE